MASLCVAQLSTLRPAVATISARGFTKQHLKPLHRPQFVVRANQKDTVSDVIDKVKEKADEFVEATQENSGITPQTLNAQPGNKDKGAIAEIEAPGTGPLPEITNGRAAMVGMLAAFGAELATHEPVLVQLQKAPALIAGGFALIILASVIPVVRGADLNRSGAGPFTPKAEVTNGRLAMVSFALLLAVETWKAGPGLVP